MKIGLLTTSYPRTPEDSAGDFVRGFSQALVSQGHEVHVLAPEPIELASGPEDEGVVVEHVPYVRPRALARTFYGAGVPDNVARDPMAAIGLATLPPTLLARAALRSRTWDAVVSHWALPSAAVAGVVRGKRPHLAVLHSADVSLLEHLPANRSIARALERSTTAFWFVSPDLRRRFERVLGRCVQKPVHVGPMGFSPAPCVDRTAARDALALRGFVVLAMARLVPIKGLEFAIEALSDRPDATLVIAGDGPSRGELERLAERRRARVRFVGFVRGAEKARWLSAADAFVMPSIELADGRSEGAPVSVLEAMHAGLPVVGTDAGGVASLVSPECGLVVRAADAGAIAHALRELERDGTLRERLSRGARARASAYRWDVLAPHIDTMITSPEF